MDQNKNNFYFIAILIFGFVFYLFYANPVNNLGFVKNNKTKLVESMQLKNIALNKFALKKLHERPIIKGEKDVYKYVSQMPRYKSCLYYDEQKAQYCTLKQIQKYSSEISLVDSSIKEDKEVEIRFVVNEFGYVKDVQLISKSKNSFLDSLAINHIQKMPKFATAGIQNNINVKVEYIVSVTFLKLIN